MKRKNGCVLMKFPGQIFVSYTFMKKNINSLSTLISYLFSYSCVYIFILFSCPEISLFETNQVLSKVIWTRITRIPSFVYDNKRFNIYEFTEIVGQRVDIAFWSVPLCSTTMIVGISSYHRCAINTTLYDSLTLPHDSKISPESESWQVEEKRSCKSHFSKYLRSATLQPGHTVFVIWPPARCNILSINIDDTKI
jgi:hypothetical protein